jgi:high-affinity Fe2+/Pb2+ permease
MILGSDKTFWTSIGLMLVIVVAVLVYAVQRHHRLIAECMADGFKEYQCVGILKGYR